MNAYASPNGNVKLNKSYGTFLAKVGINFWPTTTDEAAMGPNTINMMVNIYHKDSILTKGCLDFTNYDSVNPSIISSDKLYSSGSPVFNSLRFSCSHTFATADVFLDYSYLKLSADIFVSNSDCDSSIMSFGYGASGMIGLGFVPASFMLGNQFAIYLNPNGVTGNILFPYPPDFQTYTSIRSEFGTFAVADVSQWLISGIQFSIGSYIFPLNNLQVMFDINTEGIALPLELYKELLLALNMHVRGCKLLSFPVCYLTLPIEQFPTFTLSSPTDPSQSIDIPYPLYTQTTTDENGDGQVVLGFSALSEDETGPAYATGNYEQTVFLGQNFLTYYFTVFNGIQKSVQFFKAATEPVN